MAHGHTGWDTRLFVAVREIGPTRATQFVLHRVDALSARTYNHCWPCDYLGPCLFFAFAARCAGQVTAMQMRLRETRKRRPAFR